MRSNHIDDGVNSTLDIDPIAGRNPTNDDDTEAAAHHSRGTPAAEGHSLEAPWDVPGADRSSIRDARPFEAGKGPGAIVPNSGDSVDAGPIPPVGPSMPANARSRRLVFDLNRPPVPMSARTES